MPERAWRVLLECGSDGDLIVIKPADVKNINPLKRIHPLVWGTSNGDFETTEVDNVDIKFTESSRINIFSVEPDIIMLDKSAPNPAFGMILGVDTLREFGVILNFADSTITIDHHEVITRPLNACNNVGTRRHILKQQTGPWEP